MDGQAIRGGLGVKALRITGGEPTVRPGLVDWIRTIRDTLPAIHNIAMTTNGVLLDRVAPQLADAGVDRVNISLDSLRPDRFRIITRGGELKRVQQGISAAIDSFHQVKVNVVALQNGNMDELEDFVRFSDRLGVDVRLIEPMPLGTEKDYWRDVYISVDEIHDLLSRAGFELIPCSQHHGFAPATSYTVPGTRARLGFISQMSCTKCADCNKLRLTSDGTLRPCLLSAEEIPLQQLITSRNTKGFLNAMSTAFLERAFENNPEDATRKSLGRSMECIGG